jgi:hypothetical protein
LLYIDRITGTSQIRLKTGLLEMVEEIGDCLRIKFAGAASAERFYYFFGALQNKTTLNCKNRRRPINQVLILFSIVTTSMPFW